MSRRLLTAAVTVLVLAAAGWLAAPYVESAAFVLDLAGSGGWVRRMLPVRVRRVTTRDLEVPTRYGPVAARVYQPDTPATRSILVVPGVHAGGVDEPRLATFSRRLAGTGLIVLTVPLPELRRYRITPVSTDMIEDAVAWMTADTTLAPRGQVGLVGVSFAGGLALVAAGRPSLAGKVQMVVSLGGQADLPRVMTYLCTGRLPDGTRRPPHDYGVDVILLAAIPHLVPADQVDLLRQDVLTFLDASSFYSMDRGRSDALFAEARRMGDAAPEPTRTLMKMVNDRNVSALGPKLLPYIEELGGAAALSPDRSPATHAPVYLLHGMADNVIPSTETPLLSAYLEAHGNSRVRFLLTPLLTHADLEAASAADAWRLIRFWTEMLEAP